LEDFLTGLDSYLSFIVQDVFLIVVIQIFQGGPIKLFHLFDLELQFFLIIDWLFEDSEQSIKDEVVLPHQERFHYKGALVLIRNVIAVLVLSDLFLISLIGPMLKLQRLYDVDGCFLLGVQSKVHVQLREV